VPLGVCDRCYCRAKRKRRSGAGQVEPEGGIPTPSLNRPPPPLSTAPGAPEDPRLCHAPAQTDATTASACPYCRFFRERISHLERVVDQVTLWPTLARSKAAGLRVRFLTALLPRATSRVRPPTGGDFLVAWRDGALWNARDGTELQAIAATILRRSTPSDVCLRHANGRKVVYACKITARKPMVGRIQSCRRLVHGVRLLSGAVVRHASAAVAAGAVSVTVTAPGCRRGRGSGALVPISATPEQQLGLIARHVVSLSASNGPRMGLGGSQVGLASLPVLQEARKRLAGLLSKRVFVTASGAHRMSIKAAVHEKLEALSASSSFVERLLRDKYLQPVSQTVAYEAPPADDPGSSAAAPPENVMDVHLALGLDKGGHPSSMKIVMGVINQRRPQKLGSAILLAVCPANKGRYDEVAEFLSEHLEQVRKLVREGVVVG